MTDPRDRALYLIGFMGAGKNAVGEALAELLGWELVDTDALVERRELRSVASIFAESGEPYFRRVESAALASVAGRRRVVVAGGGGVFLRADNRRLIQRTGRSVWLDVPLHVASERVGEAGGRPLWVPRDPLEFRAFFERRRAIYALADVRVDASGGAPGEVARRVLHKVSAVFR
jgi:shikimate kinase